MPAFSDGAKGGGRCMEKRAGFGALRGLKKKLRKTKKGLAFSGEVWYHISCAAQTGSEQTLNRKNEVNT